MVVHVPGEIGLVESVDGDEEYVLRGRRLAVAAAAGRRRNGTSAESDHARGEPAEK